MATEGKRNFDFLKLPSLVWVDVLGDPYVPRLQNTAKSPDRFGRGLALQMRYWFRYLYY